MTTFELGQIESVDVGRLWRGEGVEFARWLSENLQLLGAPLHMDIELVRLEPPVTGSWFWFSILAREVGSDANVAIVHQRGETNHDSLGQLVGYAARHNVRILVWVTSNFTDDHRKALEWLNQWTGEEIEVYGVEVRAIKIGDSLPAHRFHPVVFADAWSKRAQRALTGLSPSAQRHYEFFQPLVEDLWNAGFTNQTTARTRGGQSFATGHPGITYNVGFGWGKALVYIWISAGEPSKSVRIFDALLKHEAELQTELPGLQFDLIGQLGGRHRVSAGMSRDGSLNDPDDGLQEVRQWMFDNLIAIKTTFQPHLEAVMTKLQAEQSAAEESASEDASAAAAEVDSQRQPESTDDGETAPR
jgi:hypothetical protein